MTPKQFEAHVAELFVKKGFEVQITPFSGDYGVDIFGIKGKEKIAVQVKMYGTARKINREMVMQLHGAKDYFDCSQAIIATNGEFLVDAQEVAKKLKIEIIKIEAALSDFSKDDKKATQIDFDSIWEKYILPLKGKKLIRANGDINEIANVNWGGIERTSSRGNQSKIKIEIFKYAVNKLLHEGNISRDEINQNYIGRASSGVILILSQVPYFELTNKPIGLKHNKLIQH